MKQKDNRFIRFGKNTSCPFAKTSCIDYEAEEAMRVFSQPMFGMVTSSFWSVIRFDRFDVVNATDMTIIGRNASQNAVADVP